MQEWCEKEERKGYERTNEQGRIRRRLFANIPPSMKERPSEGTKWQKIVRRVGKSKRI